MLDAQSCRPCYVDGLARDEWAASLSLGWRDFGSAAPGIAVQVLGGAQERFSDAAGIGRSHPAVPGAGTFADLELDASTRRPGGDEHRIQRVVDDLHVWRREQEEHQNPDAAANAPEPASPAC